MEFSNARPCKPATVAALAVLTLFSARAQAQTGSYLGFDRNTYPGDANLKALHQTFSYTGSSTDASTRN
jgi:hypothetical protein